VHGQTTSHEHVSKDVPSRFQAIAASLRSVRSQRPIVIFAPRFVKHCELGRPHGRLFQAAIVSVTSFRALFGWARSRGLELAGS
jgi:hypothetical protein